MRTRGWLGTRIFIRDRLNISHKTNINNMMSVLKRVRVCEYMYGRVRVRVCARHAAITADFREGTLWSVARFVFILIFVERRMCIFIITLV